MDPIEILLAQKTSLLAQLSDANKAVSDAKWGKRGDEKDAVKSIEKQLKNIDKAIKDAEKFGYLSTAAENGIDVRGNVVKGITDAVSSVASSAANVMTAEFGVFGKGKVGVAEQKRLGDKPNAVNLSNPFGSMDQKTIWMLLAGAFILVIVIFKRK